MMWPWTEWWGLAIAVASWMLTAAAVFAAALLAAEAARRVYRRTRR